MGIVHCAVDGVDNPVQSAQIMIAPRFLGKKDRSGKPLGDDLLDQILGGDIHLGDEVVDSIRLAADLLE